jgi:phage gp37-like protein
MAKAPEQKSTRFSRWRAQRRGKVLRAREISHRVKAERSRDMDRHPRGGDGGWGGMGGDGGAM